MTSHAKAVHRRFLKYGVDVLMAFAAAAIFFAAPGAHSQPVSTAAGPSAEPRATPLGDRVNSAVNDVAPKVSAGGKTLYFSSVRAGGYGSYDMYVIRRGSDGWSAPTALPVPINSPYSEGGASFSADGHTMVFDACEKPDSVGGCDLYITTLEGNVWAAPRNMGRNVNSAVDDGQPSLSADGSALIFVSSRAGGFGGIDLWITRRDTNGEWSEPLNLGFTVNTPKNEHYPFLAADGKTLYFASDGHRGLGGYDIFRSVQVDAAAASRPFDVEAVSGTYRGRWSSQAAAFDAELVLQVAADRNVQGHIAWVQRASSRPNDSRIGKSAVEYVQGTFDPHGRVFLLRGVRKDDPSGAIALDRYRLQLTEDGSRLEGSTAGNKADWNASLTADRIGPVQKLSGFALATAPNEEPAVRTWRLDASNEIGRWTGQLEIKRVAAGVWKGRIRYDQHGNWEPIEEIRLTPVALSFYRPNGVQNYQATIRDGTLSGTYTWGGNRSRWTATETTPGAAASRAPQPTAAASASATRAWNIDASNETGRWTGQIEIERVAAGVWKGRIRYEQHGNWEPIQEIRMTTDTLTFHRPLGDQRYRAVIRDRLVTGSYTWGGSRVSNWSGTEISSPTSASSATREPVAPRTDTAAWTAPVNLGAPFNSASDDRGFTVGGSADTAYFASRRPGGTGEYDLYSAPLPTTLRPEPTALVSGVVTRDGGAAAEADVVVENLTTGRLVAQLKANAATGRYQVVLPVGATYGISVARDGHFFVSARFDVPVGSSFVELTRDIRLIPIVKGARAVLNNVFFHTGKSDLSSESRLEINRAAGLLRANPRVVVELAGHTDDVGTAEFNLKLSGDRARVVRDALVSQGIRAERLVARGYGNTRPVAVNTTDEGRSANRRTEMLVLSD